MQTKLKISAIFPTLLFALTPLTSITANAITFEKSIPSFGLYCENENSVLYGNVKYVIDENGKAVQYSEYSVNSGTFYVPFISSAYNIPEIGGCSISEICYGSPIGLRNDFAYDFYSSDLNGMTGTVYTLNTKSESFTVNFTMLENQNCICRLTQGFRLIRDSKHIESTINNARTDIPYEVFILNGDCADFESSAEITKETVTVKKYIDGVFNEFKDYYSVGGSFKPAPDLFYALAKQAAANNINYEFLDFFIDSFTQMRLNAYKIEVQAPCKICFSMPANVQKAGSFTPEVFRTDRTATGSYEIDYTIELNGKLPYIIEHSADVKQQSGYIYTARSVTDDFYFVFSSAEKPKSISVSNKNGAATVLIVISFAVCALILSVIFTVLHCKKTEK